MTGVIAGKPERQTPTVRATIKLRDGRKDVVSWTLYPSTLSGTRASTDARSQIRFSFAFGSNVATTSSMSVPGENTVSTSANPLDSALLSSSSATWLKRKIIC